MKRWKLEFRKKMAAREIAENMISIVNIGPHNQNDPMGERTYSVRINSEEVVRFRHKRADGLGACLLAASKAVEAEKWEKADKLLMELTADRKSNQKVTLDAHSASVRSEETPCAYRKSPS